MRKNQNKRWLNRYEKHIKITFRNEKNGMCELVYEATLCAEYIRAKWLKLLCRQRDGDRQSRQYTHNSHTHSESVASSRCKWNFQIFVFRFLHLTYITAQRRHTLVHFIYLLPSFRSFYDWIELCELPFNISTSLFHRIPPPLFFLCSSFYSCLLLSPLPRRLSPILRCLSPSTRYFSPCLS